MKNDVVGRPVPFEDPTLQYDHETLITKTGGFTVMQVPTQPYAFADTATRRDMGWLATLSLAALKKGRVTIKTVHVPTDVNGQAALWDARVQQTGQPGPGFGEHLDSAINRAREVAPTTKQTFIVAAVGPRSMSDQLAWRQESEQEKPRWWERRPQPLAPITERERVRFAGLASPVRTRLAAGGYRARPVGVETVRALRRHAASRSVDVEPMRSGRSRWQPSDVVSEFADLQFLPGPDYVRVDGPGGSRYVATLVCHAFPQSMLFPSVDPWLAHLDRLPAGVVAESDLVLDLVPLRQAKKDLERQEDKARDQLRDASNAGWDLPFETQEILSLAPQLAYTLPRKKLPMAYGWARIRVDAGSPQELREKCEIVTDHMGTIARTGIDLARPQGAAQVDLLHEGIVGAPVKSKSWKQRWMLDTVACSLQHAGSELGHADGSFKGRTTGREVRAVHLNSHHSITRRSSADVEQPGGRAYLGAPRAGKSGAFAVNLYDNLQEGIVSLVLDPPGRLKRVLDLPKVRGRGDSLDLVTEGGGIADPLGPVLIPFPAEAYPDYEGLTSQTARDREDARVRHARQRTWDERARLAREHFTTLAYRKITEDSDVETALLASIDRVVTSSEASALAVIADLKRQTSKAAKSLGSHLAFEFRSNDESSALFGVGAKESDVAALGGDLIARVLSMDGLVLPPHTKAQRDWSPAQSLAAATFSSAAYLARRMLFQLPKDQLKVLAIDEAHVLLATADGRAFIDYMLRHGPKNGIITDLATHNAGDLVDEKIMAAISQWFLFRTKSTAEMKASHTAAGLPDTDANRQLRADLRNGECIAVLDTGVMDRFQWDQEWQEGLKEAANTTSSGRAPAVVGAVEVEKTEEVGQVDLVKTVRPVKKAAPRQRAASSRTGGGSAVATAVLAAAAVASSVESSTGGAE